MQTQHAHSPLILGLVSSLTLAHATAWEKLPTLPEPGAGFVAGCVNGKIIVAGGTNWRDGVKRWLDTVWLFDPATNQWAIGPKLPHSVAYATFASDGTRLYFAGGADGKQGRREVYALDAELQLTHLGDLPQPIVFSGGALHEGSLYAFGGTPDPDDWSKGSNTFFAFHLAEGKALTLTPVQAVHSGIGIPAVVATRAGIHSFTGAWIDTQVIAHNTDEAFAYEPATQTWLATTPYPKATRGVSAVVLDEQHLYLAGGYGTDAEGFVAEAFIYDLKSRRYTPAKPLPIPLNTTLVKLDEHVYLIGGEDQKKHRTAAFQRIRISDLLADSAVSR